MTVLRNFLPAIVCASVLAVSAMTPAVAAETTKLVLEGWLGGFRIGNLLLTITRGPSSYDADIALRSTGIARWYSGLDAEFRSSGEQTGDAAATASYVQHMTSNRSERLVEIKSIGTPPIPSRIQDVIKRKVELDPDKDPDNVSPIPTEMLRGSVDPFAAILIIGSRIAKGEKSFTLPVYDGRRRFDMKVASDGKAKHMVLGRNYETVDALVTVTPVAGFLPATQKRLENAKLEVAVDPINGLPVKLATRGFPLQFVMNLAHTCPPEPSCSLPNEDGKE